MKKFQSISPDTITENAIKLIGTDWMLITAGNKEKCNTMTASWGALGMLWNKPVAICFVRPQRYTFDFIEKADYFSLSFFEEKYREALKICGKESGRDVNKIEKTGLQTIADPKGFIYFEEASLVLGCRKLYSGFIDPAQIIDKSILKLYNNDYHKMYIGEISECFKSIDLV